MVGLSTEVPSQRANVPARQTASAEQLVWYGFQPMGKQLDVLQQGEGCPGRSPINEVRITTLPGERRLLGGDQVCSEALIP